MLDGGSTDTALSKAGANVEVEVKAQGRYLLSAILKSYASKLKQISLVVSPAPLSLPPYPLPHSPHLMSHVMNNI